MGQQHSKRVVKQPTQQSICETVSKHTRVNIETVTIDSNTRGVLEERSRVYQFRYKEEGVQQLATLENRPDCNRAQSYLSLWGLLLQVAHDVSDCVVGLTYRVSIQSNTHHKHTYVLTSTLIYSHAARMDRLKFVKLDLNHQYVPNLATI